MHTLVGGEVAVTVRAGNLRTESLAGLARWSSDVRLYVVNFRTATIAVLTSVDTLSGEIASGTVHAVVGIISSFLLASEALWKRAAFEMQSPLVRALGFSPFSTPSAPSVLMVVYAHLYLLVALLLAVRRSSSRDL